MPRFRPPAPAFPAALLALALFGLSPAAADTVSHPSITTYPTLKAQAKTGVAAVDRVSMSAAARNSMYSCQFSSVTAGFGFSWVSSSNVISFAGKPMVEGSVAWTSYFKNTASGTVNELGGNGLPNHYTGTFPTDSSTEAGQRQYHPNPSAISTNRIYYQLPANPTLAASPQCVGGTVGVLFTGAMLYNALDADGRDAVANEIKDLCEGHPQGDGQYHYHHLSNCFTDSSSGHSVQVGYALDGFGIYGPKGVDGTTLTNADLDVCHGHTHSVTDIRGTTSTVYHYHGNEEFPYVVGCFRGSTSARATTLTTPESGFWYTSTAGGRGFGMEVQGSSMFIGIYTYDSSGADIWYVGSCTLGTTTCAGTLQSYSGGTTLANLGIAASTPASAASPGTFSVTFSSTTAATVTITPGSGTAATYALSRYPINGTAVVSAPSWAPASGWWWSADYPGTGWFIESQDSVVQNGATYARLFAVGYAYGSTGGTGRANWYVGSGLYGQTSSTVSLFSGSLSEYVNGPTLTGGAAAALALFADRGTTTIQFTSSTTATVTLPNGRQIAIQRYTF